MVGTRTVIEDYAGVNPEYSDTIYCDECGNEIEPEGSTPYRICAESSRGETMCANCITAKSDSGEWEEVFNFIGYYNIYDVLEKLNAVVYY